MPDEKDPSAELSARPLDREAARELMKKIRARAEAAAEEGAAKRDASIAAEKEKTAGRIAELRRQGEELLAAERKPE